MAGFGDAIKYLYEKFILRDVLSFVTPGALIVATALFVFYREIFCLYIPWPFYIPLFGLFFMVGFAVQCLGEILGLIRIDLTAKGCCHQRFKIFGCKWAEDKSIIWWKEAHIDVVNLAEATQDKEWAQQQNERLVVLKQMCANGFLAIVIAGVLLAISHCQSMPAKVAVASIVALLLLVSLLWGYRVHELRRHTMQQAIRHLPINGKKESQREASPLL